MSKKIIICKNCKKEKEHGAFGLCRVCYVREWRLKNPEKKKLQDKKYRMINSEEIKESQKKWKLNHPKGKKKIQRKYYLKHREQEAERRKKHRASIHGKLWWRQYDICKRTGLDASMVPKVIYDNFLRYGANRCEKCKQFTGLRFHIDHIIPISKGGDNGHENLQLLCPKCNLKKGTKTTNYKQVFYLPINEVSHV